jgi:hypothetical protein
MNCLITSLIFGKLYQNLLTEKNPETRENLLAVLICAKSFVSLLTLYDSIIFVKISRKYF